MYKTITIAGEEISAQDFFDAISSFNDFDGTQLHEIITDENKEEKENLIKNINNNIEYIDDESKNKLIELKNDLEKNQGKVFARFELSYHNKALNFLFKLLCKYGLFEIRYSNEE